LASFNCAYFSIGFRSRKLYETAPDRYKQLAISDAHGERGVARQFSGFLQVVQLWHAHLARVTHGRDAHATAKNYSFFAT
jgi:hypothetical protein